MEIEPADCTFAAGSDQASSYGTESSDEETPPIHKSVQNDKMDAKLLLDHPIDP